MRGEANSKRNGTENASKSKAFFPHEFPEMRNLSKNDMDVFYHRELQRGCSERESFSGGIGLKRDSSSCVITLLLDWCSFFFQPRQAVRGLRGSRILFHTEVSFKGARISKFS